MCTPCAAGSRPGKRRACQSSRYRSQIRAKERTRRRLGNLWKLLIVPACHFAGFGKASKQKVEVR